MFESLLGPGLLALAILGKYRQTKDTHSAIEPIRMMFFGVGIDLILQCRRVEVRMHMQTDFIVADGMQHCSNLAIRCFPGACDLVKGAVSWQVAM